MPRPQPQLVASGNINACRFVKQDGDFRGAEANANERVIGISKEGSKYPPLSDLVTTNYHAILGDPIGLNGEGDECLLELGGTVTAGDLLKSDNDGKGVAIATTGTTMQNYGARALQGGGSGEKIRVQVKLGEVYPALT